MSNALELSLLCLLVASVSACDDKSTVGCTKDAECKGNRVCSAGACVDAKPAETSPAEAVVSPAEEPKAAAADRKSAPATPAAADAKPTPPTEPAKSTQASCRVLLEHVTDVLRTTGSEATKAGLKSPEASIARCEAQTNDPVLVQCFMDATTEAAVDACNIAGFPGEVDGTATRRTEALEDNSGLTPPIFTLDGDYMSWDKDCGILYREAPPAGALFIACKDKVKIGPIVNAAKLDSVMAELSDQSRSRHDLVMGIIDNYPKGRLGVKVHVYDSDGTYRGIQER